MKNYLKFPLPTTASWFRLPERVKELEDNPINAADYDLADFTNTGIDPFTKASDLPPYKVYTALLTQSGGDDVQTISSGELTIGVTYRIENSHSANFMNVGAPNNGIGTYFVATGTSPNWGSNPSVLLSYNTGAPVVTVLENTIGNIWFAYNVVGYYQVSSEPESFFPVGKTVGFLGSVGDDAAGVSYGFLRLSGSYFFILTQGPSQTDANNQLNNTPIEIRVYN